MVAGARQIISALAWCHSKGLVHSDLHSGNVLRSACGSNWLLADFGNADWELQEGTTQHTRLTYSKSASALTYLCLLSALAVCCVALHQLLSATLTLTAVDRVGGLHVMCFSIVFFAKQWW